MTGLPASIEAYLLETGFSQTEILVLKKLLEGEALTLRELAAKTGKSTGVLDQATKKLLNKNILSKENINDGLKYTLGSIQAITRWVEKDMLEKRSNLERKHQNFEMFISSLEIDRDRPEMEYFEGDEGIKKAYMKLLECGGKEFLHYFPVEFKEEEDPLCDFRVQYFRERRKRKIFSRYIVHDTPLARRFQSRDAFEYRKTVLVPEDRCPFQFEKIICKDIVAAFEHNEKKVCFIKFPNLAYSERNLFEALWQPQLHALTERQQEIHYDGDEVSVQTRTLSGLREFFLNKKSMGTFFLLGLSSLFVTVLFHTQANNLNFLRIQQQLTSIASTAALQFDPDDLTALQMEADWRLPAWSKVVKQLELIRESNKEIVYVYILRKNPENPLRIDFVADSHSLNPYANSDDNPTNDVDSGDGIGSSLLAWPGQEYQDAPTEVFDAFEAPTASEEFYEDIWGKLLSGYAPIRDANENVVAILAIDMSDQKFREVSEGLTKPILYFSLLFLIFVFIRMHAFNKPLFKEVLKRFHISTFTAKQ